MSFETERENFFKFFPSLGLLLFFSFSFPLPCLSGWNNPYPAGEAKGSTYFSDFRERPKHLDPAIAYSSDEYRFLAQIYEPLVQYHYLKRPYELIPLTAEVLPEYTYYAKNGAKLIKNAPASKVAKTVWTLRLRPGIYYQNHPCFAKDGSGNPLYVPMTQKDMKGIRTLFDFPEEGTRQLKAADYVRQIKRLADPRNHSPIFSMVLTKYIEGMEVFSRTLQNALKVEREKRRQVAKEKGDFLFNREEDEKKNPLWINYDEIPCSGLKVIDSTTFEITIRGKYPQFKYWLAMPFFAPMPQEALKFYSQGPMVERNIVLDWYPVGTGPFRLAEYNPNHRVVLVKNENYHEEFYPAAKNEGPKEKLRLPFIKKAVFSREMEVAPRWHKFKQGFYDLSGIAEDNFLEVMDFSSGSSLLNQNIKSLGIQLARSVDTTVYYLGFNLNDPVVGGLSEKQCKLRQALSIAIDRKQSIQIFRNGRCVYNPFQFLPERRCDRNGLPVLNCR